MAAHPITEQRLILQTPDMSRVSVDHDIPYGSDTTGDLGMDIYRPPAATRAQLPAVIFATGYSDIGARQMLGRNLKDWAAYVDWARLVASSGAIAITYSNEDPMRDIRELIQHIRKNAESLGVDAQRMGIWSCSGNASAALAALQEYEELRCAALCYGYMIDTPGNDDVARAAAQFGFINATAELAVEDLRDVPILVARAGADEMPGLNHALDRFVARSLAANLPISLINHASGPHAFDISDTTEETRQVIRQILQFLELRLEVRAEHSANPVTPGP